jgi:hypothetical protein
MIEPDRSGRTAPRARDCRILRKLKEVSGRRFAGGGVLYDGETSAGFGDGMYALPVRARRECSTA